MIPPRSGGRAAEGRAFQPLPPVARQRLDAKPPATARRAFVPR